MERCTRVQLCLSFRSAWARVPFAGVLREATPGESLSDPAYPARTFRDRIDSFGYEFLSFETRKMEAGQKYSGETANRELAIVVLGEHLLGNELAGRVA